MIPLVYDPFSVWLLNQHNSLKTKLITCVAVAKAFDSRPSLGKSVHFKFTVAHLYDGVPGYRHCRYL